MIDLDSILNRYIPDDSENSDIQKTVQEMITRIRARISELGINATPVLVGSVAKHTNLKNADLDIFIVFGREYSIREMESIGLRIGHEVLPGGVERYAEHPYVSGYSGPRKIDIVPCFQIESNAKIISSVDRTPLHTEYVLSKLPAAKRRDVLLLKLFMKSVGVYGSEIKTRGFSGYVCELLVISLGGFESVLKFFAETRGRILIPRESHLASRFDSPMIIEDPTDITRNAAAAVSMENISRMRIESKLYLESPSEKYFEPLQEIGPQAARDRGTCLRIIRLPRPELVDDIIFSQADRLRRILESHLDDRGFRCIDSDVHTGSDIQVIIETELCNLPAAVRHTGPPADSQNAVSFVRKWSNQKIFRGPYVCGDRICVDVFVERRKIDQEILSIINGTNIGKNLNRLKSEVEIIDPLKTGQKYEILGRYYYRSLVT